MNDVKANLTQTDRTWILNTGNNPTPPHLADVTLQWQSVPRHAQPCPAWRQECCTHHGQPRPAASAGARVSRAAGPESSQTILHGANGASSQEEEILGRPHLKNEYHGAKNWPQLTL